MRGRSIEVRNIWEQRISENHLIKKQESDRDLFLALRRENPKIWKNKRCSSTALSAPILQGECK